MPLFDQASKLAADFVPPVVAAPAGLGSDTILDASQALTADVTITDMQRDFLAHQGAAYLYVRDAIARWGCAFIGDDMGMGKTQVLLAAIRDAVEAGGYAILVGPPVALGTYESELAATFPHLRLAHLKGRKPNGIPQADIYFVSDDPLTMEAWLTAGYDRQGKVIPAPLVSQARIYVRDEIHRDKGRDGKATSKRAKISLAAGKALRSVGRTVIGVTGTLLVNRPIESVVPLEIVGGADLLKALAGNGRAKWDYVQRFCNPVHNGYGYDYGASDLPVLHENLRRTVYVRREREDLGDLLPHGGWVVTPLALNGRMARYERVERNLLSLIREEKGPEAAWRAARAEALVQMQAMYEEAGVAKADAAADYVLDLVNEGNQVVVFYTHARVFEAMAKKLIKAKVATTVINGSVTGQARTDAQDEFQRGDAKVMLAQVRSAGMAITLTAAAHAVFVQVPWSAGDLAQAAARIKRADAISMERARRGQAVTFHVLQAAYEDGTPTFDHAMWSILEHKAAVCDAVNAGRDITLPDESVVKQALTAWYEGAEVRAAKGRFDFGPKR